MGKRVRAKANSNRSGSRPGVRRPAEASETTPPKASAGDRKAGAKRQGEARQPKGRKDGRTSRAPKPGETTSPGKTTAQRRAVKRTAAQRAAAAAPAPGATRSKRPAASRPREADRLPRTHLTDDELREFRALLLRKRAELAGDVRDLRRHTLDSENRDGLEHSAMPIHMAELGTDNWEKEFTLGLIASERDLVREVDEALERIRNKSYGVCIVTHRRISKARLRAKPWARYCIQYARAREEGRAV